MRKIPKCMSTQHPDNVHIPFFANNSVIGGEDEIQEAFYVFSHLDCDEQMWDCEGKEVDDFVVKKLLTKYESFFREKRLGKDVFITLRVPNPAVEKAEAKVLLETLESIPRSFDAAKLFSNDEISPVFEVILPMIASSNCIDRVYRYYRDFVAGKGNKSLKKGDITIAEWIGELKPASINVIPLFEDMESLLDAHSIVKEYLRDKNIDSQRVFLARSDPAMNYGLISAVLLNKIALWNLCALSKEIGVGLYPIIGAGSAPFRGNLKPSTVKKIVNEYAGTHTFTVQSAFKYDNPPNVVREAVMSLKEREESFPREVDIERCLNIIKKYCKEYQKQVKELAQVINKVARYVPNKRKRKLHIGLFAYSRDMGGITLPRPIKFTAALYSIGLPPELLGLNALDKNDIAFLKEVYVNFEDDLRDAFQFFNEDSSIIPDRIKQTVRDFPIDFRVNEEHKAITNHIIACLNSDESKDFQEFILSAASLRSFLG